jgi:hypothetical protein
MKEALLRDLKTYKCEYNGFLTNHSVSGAFAVNGLDGEPGVQRWYQAYSERLEKWGREEEGPELPTDMSLDDLFVLAKEEKLKKAQVPQIRALVSSQSSSLDEVIERLLPSVGSAALHGLIGCGYALKVSGGDKTLLVDHWLAYWIASYKPLGAVLKEGTRSLEDILDICVEIGKEPNIFPDSSLTFTQARMNVANSQAKEYEGKYDLNLSALDLSKVRIQLLNSISQLLIQTGGRSFFILHGITSSYALLTILEQLKSEKLQKDLIRTFFRHFLYVYVAENAPAPSKGTKAAEISLDEAVELVLAPGIDEHLIKLGHLAKKECVDLPLVAEAFKKVVEEVVVKKQGFSFYNPQGWKKE